MLAGSLKIEDDHNLAGLSIWGATESIGNYNRDFKSNEKKMTNLMSNILSAFPEDKDGDRWMLCK